MADEDDDNSISTALEECTMVQSMIEINAHHLFGLRTKCAISAELTQQEIRTQECKLLKLFSRQLLNRAKVTNESLLPDEVQREPFLRLWLRVVGLGVPPIDAICVQANSLECLVERSIDSTRKMLIQDAGAQEEEVRRLVSALQNLKAYTDCLKRGEQNPNLPLDLHWDSWDRGEVPTTPRSLTSSSGLSGSVNLTGTNSLFHPSIAGNNGCNATGNGLGGSSPASSPVPRLYQPTRQNRTSVPSDADGPRTPYATSSSPSSFPVPPWSPASVNFPSSGDGSFHAFAHSASPRAERRYTPPNTPPVLVKKGEKMKFPTTPPPRKKQTITNLVPDSFPLTKSKSHESQLANRIEAGDNSLLSYEQLPRRQRLATEPNLETAGGGLFDVGGGGGGISGGPSERSSPQVSSPVRSPPYINPDQNSLPDEPVHKSVPKSPRTPTIAGYHMGHFIQHRFTKTLKVTTCDLCFKQMFFGYKCKECKYKCHRDCSDKVPPSCGLPLEYLDVYRQTLQNEDNASPILSRGPLSSPLPYPKDSNHYQRLRRQHPNISIQPFSGADSSSNTSSCNSSTPSSPALAMLPTPTPPSSSGHYQQFQFPDVANADNKGITIETRPLTDTQNEMVETQKSNDSDKTVSGTSGSTDSEKTLAGRVDSQDSQISDVDPLDRSWPRQNSLSLREWDIPFDELNIGDKVGTGRFGIVYKGNWHGDVAIKVLNMDHMDDEKTLDAFKQEVATFRKTRHENLVLFMGACMKPPRLAIVTSLCKGKTLYTHIHLLKERFNMNRTILIAQQILQGMGYLHARGIVHKDLKTKNIFLENGKVIITDFGLFSVTKLCYGNRKGNWLTIPPGWLCYLAPEILCRLRAAHDCQENDNLPFTMPSDVYAFGTVWYELLCGEWPFKGQPPEAIIWQVGRGIKQSLATIQASRDVKDILMLCWSFKADDRPEFSSLLKVLERLPKKRLARSPSHPIHLSRSAESVF